MTPTDSHRAIQIGVAMNTRHANLIWASLPRENASSRKISTKIHHTELVILAGSPPPRSRYGEWVLQLHDLERFAAAHANRFPNRGAHDADEASLGEWVHHQVQRQHTMCAYAYARLESVPGWTWSRRDDGWADRFADLATFTREHPDPPSRAATDPDERSLSRWVQRKRDAARAGNLSEERRIALRTLGYPMPPATR
jgi:hypothetical protein